MTYKSKIKLTLALRKCKFDIINHQKGIILKTLCMKKFAVLLWTCIALSGCTTTPKVDFQAEKDVIQNNEDQWTVALQTRDAEKIVGSTQPRQ